jgi:hypothetical protein
MGRNELQYARVTWSVESVYPLPKKIHEDNEMTGEFFSIISHGFRKSERYIDKVYRKDYDTSHNSHSSRKGSEHSNQSIISVG